MEYVISTPCGKVGGIDCKRDGIVAYKGIRYATASRFEPPVEVTHWSEAFNADHYGPCAPQPRAFKNEWEDSSKAFYYNEFRKDEKYEYSEDCLRLNIWTPKYVVTRTALERYSKRDSIEYKLPVIVYIHGGNYTTGCGHEKPFDDPIWPICDVIAVTINYRLGPLGFACFPEFLEGDNKRTNLGLQDQLCALSWIKHNIASFGGDVDNITLMGQSAGAMGITQLMLSDKSKGLFNKVVLSSGGGISNLTAPKHAEERFEDWKKVLTKTSAQDLESLKKISLEEYFKAWDEVINSHSASSRMCDPVIDGYIVQQEESVRAKSEDYVNCPMIIGVNSEDFIGPVFAKMAGDFVKCSSDLEHTFEYVFERVLPGDNYGAFHSADLWYWFGTLDNCWRPFEDVDRDLSKNMIMFLTNFAKTGDVNLAELPVEPADDSESQNHDKKERTDDEKVLRGYGLPKWEHSKAGYERMIFSDEVGMGRLSFVALVNNMIFHKSP